MNQTWMASFPDGFYWPDSNDKQDEFIFYHHASGELLIINKLGKFILELIYKQAYIEQDIVLMVCQSFDIECDKDISNAVYSTLHKFKTLGLLLTKDAE